MRISSAVASAFLLVACSQEQDSSDVKIRGVSMETPSESAASRIECARGPGSLAADCTVDRVQEPRGLVLTVRHPDGAFRRLLVTADGRGVVAADGAEPARVSVIGPDAIEVAIGADRYRLPATVRAPG